MSNSIEELARIRGQERWKDELAKVIQQLVMALVKTEDAPASSFAHACKANQLLDLMLR